MPDWILILPLVFPAFGSFAFAQAARRVGIPQRHWLAILLCAIQIALILLNAAPGAHQLAVSEWETTGIAFAFQMDGITFLLCLALFVIPLTVLLVNSPSEFDPFPFLVLNASIFLLAAATPLTVFFAAVALDATLLGWRMARGIEVETAPRSFAIGQVVNIAYFAGALLVAAKFPNEGAELLAFALWGRLGLFPFHWFPLFRGSAPRDLWVARGAPLIAGLNLWLHWDRMQVAPPAGTVAILAVLTSLGILWGAREEEEPSRAASTLLSSAALLVPLVIAFGGDAAPALGMWVTFGIVFALALYEIALKWRPERRTRVTRLLWIAGLMAFAGLPLTPAFLGNAGVYESLWEARQFGVLVIVALTNLVVFQLLWRIGKGIQGAEPRPPNASEAFALIGIMGAYFTLPLASLQIASAVGEPLSLSVESALSHVIRTNNVEAVTAAFAILLIPLAGAWLLMLANWHMPARLDALGHALARLWQLDWLVRPLASLVYWTSALARNLMAVVEENPTVWILLAALWVAILILIPR